jgi:hypothetical protein
MQHWVSHKGHSTQRHVFFCGAPHAAQHHMSLLLLSPLPLLLLLLLLSDMPVHLVGQHCVHHPKYDTLIDALGEAQLHACETHPHTNSK